MLKIWKLQISLFGILFATIMLEVSIIPSIWGPLRVDFLIGLIIGQVVFIPFSQGFPFVILASLMVQAFSGARLGLIPLLYIGVFLVTDLLKNLIYLENVFTQAFLGMTLYLIMTVVMTLILGLDIKGIMVVPLVSGTIITGIVSPLMASIVGRLQVAYDADES